MKRRVWNSPNLQGNFIVLTSDNLKAPPTGLRDYPAVKAGSSLEYFSQSSVLEQDLTCTVSSVWAQPNSKKCKFFGKHKDVILDTKPFFVSLQISAWVLRLASWKRSLVSDDWTHVALSRIRWQAQQCMSCPSARSRRLHAESKRGKSHSSDLRGDECQVRSGTPSWRSCHIWADPSEFCYHYTALCVRRVQTTCLWLQSWWLTYVGRKFGNWMEDRVHDCKNSCSQRSHWLLNRSK